MTRTAESVLLSWSCPPVRIRTLAGVSYVAHVDRNAADAIATELVQLGFHVEFESSLADPSEVFLVWRPSRLAAVRAGTATQSRTVSPRHTLDTPCNTSGPAVGEPGP